MQLRLRDARGTTGNVSTVKYYTVPATELDCTRKEPAFKISIVPFSHNSEVDLSQSLLNVYFNDGLTRVFLSVVVVVMMLVFNSVFNKSIVQTALEFQQNCLPEIRIRFVGRLINLSSDL